MYYFNLNRETYCFDAGLHSVPRTSPVLPGVPSARRGMQVFSTTLTVVLTQIAHQLCHPPPARPWREHGGTLTAKGSPDRGGGEAAHPRFRLRPDKTPPGRGVQGHGARPASPRGTGRAAAGGEPPRSPPAARAAAAAAAPDPGVSPEASPEAAAQRDPGWSRSVCPRGRPGAGAARPGPHRRPRSPPQEPGPAACGAGRSAFPRRALSPPARPAASHRPPGCPGAAAAPAAPGRRGRARRPRPGARGPTAPRPPLAASAAPSAAAPRPPRGTAALGRSRRRPPWPPPGNAGRGAGRAAGRGPLGSARASSLLPEPITAPPPAELGPSVSSTPRTGSPGGPRVAAGRCSPPRPRRARPLLRWPPRGVCPQSTWRWPRFRPSPAATP